MVNRESLRAARGVVRIRLDGVPERLFERSAEHCKWVPALVECLEDDRGAGLPGREDAGNVGGVRERRTPRDVGRVVADVELAALLNEPEAGVADRRRADQPFDVVLREEVVEATLLVAGDDQG
jgi:hypothetical protein